MLFSWEEKEFYSEFFFSHRFSGFVSYSVFYVYETLESDGPYSSSSRNTVTSSVLNFTCIVPGYIYDFTSFTRLSSIKQSFPLQILS